MRTTITFLLITVAAGAFSATTGKKDPNGDVAQCVQDVQDSIHEIKAFAHDLRSHHYLQAVHDIKSFLEDLEDEKVVCEGITKEEIEKYIFEHLPADIKHCINDAAGLVIDAKTVKKDLHEHHYKEAFKMIKQMISDAHKCVEDCEKI